MKQPFWKSAQWGIRGQDPLVLDLSPVGTEPPILPTRLCRDKYHARHPSVLCPGPIDGLWAQGASTSLSSSQLASTDGKTETQPTRSPQLREQVGIQVVPDPSPPGDSSELCALGTAPHFPKSQFPHL
jgi:hypothetical protein